MRSLLKSLWLLVRNWWRVDRIRLPRSEWRAQEMEIKDSTIRRDRRVNET